MIVPTDSETIALGIRQPWIELILRGVKSIEVRSQNTRVRGTIFLYASQTVATTPAALDAARTHHLETGTLATGLVLGSVEIAATRRATAADAPWACLPPELLRGAYAWELRNPQRFARPRSVKYLPYGVWFYPFRRRNETT